MGVGEDPCPAFILGTGDKAVLYRLNGGVRDLPFLCPRVVEKDDSWIISLLDELISDIPGVASSEEETAVVF